MPEDRREESTLRQDRVDPAASSSAAVSPRTTPSAIPILAVAIVLALAGCAESARPPTGSTALATPTSTEPQAARLEHTSDTAPPPLASDPAQLAGDLVADEQALRDPSSPEPVLQAAARRQQAAYRALGRQPEWDPITRPRIPPELLDTYDRNVDARRQLTALGEAHLKDTLPAWRINPPAPAEELLGYYHEAAATFGVGWTYLAAINMIETGFGRIEGVSTAGAQGPMQFMPSTFAAYGEGGDIRAARDSIMAAGRYLAANSFANDRNHALYRYNNSNHYVEAVNQYAAIMAADPATFAGYHRWDIYYRTTGGDVLLPIGYAETTRIPVADYLASHPQ